MLAAAACDDRKAVDIKILKIKEVSCLADWILVTEGLSDVQVRAIVNAVEDRLKGEANVSPIRKEGVNEAKWALLDYGDIIINVFQPKERRYYELESFWSNGNTFKYPNHAKVINYTKFKCIISIYS